MVYLLLLPVLVQLVQPHTTMRLRRGSQNSMRTILNIVSAIRQLINLEFQVTLSVIHPDNFVAICPMLM